MLYLKIRCVLLIGLLVLMYLYQCIPEIDPGVGGTDQR